MLRLYLRTLSISSMIDLLGSSGARFLLLDRIVRILSTRIDSLAVCGVSRFVFFFVFLVSIRVGREQITIRHWRSESVTVRAGPNITGSIFSVPLASLLKQSQDLMLY
jgi:hypothetical protein